MFKAFLIALVTAAAVDILMRTRGYESVSTWFMDHLEAQVDRLRRPLDQLLARYPQKVVRRLVRWLKRDQSLVGRHAGEFGRRASKKEAKHYQTGPERLEAKPRLYLTGWPCFVLGQLGLAPRSLSRAAKGVRKLFRRGSIHLSQAAAPGMDPTSQPRIVTYRHTIRGAQILASLEGSSEVVQSVIGKMLVEKSKWQHEQGGWRQCDEGVVEPDLWGSSYATDLLLAIVEKRLQCREESRARAEEALKRTIEYLRREWEEHRWAYGKLNSAQNAPLVFHEVARALHRYDPALERAVCDWITGWLTPEGTLSAAYLEQCKDISRASANARVGYALFLAGKPGREWEPLIVSALRDFGEGINSADVAFLIDMVCTRINPLHRPAMTIRGARHS